MPYANFHSARINEPKKYFRIRQKKDEFGKGINVLYGVKKGEGEKGGKTEVQAIRFAADTFTPDEAKNWLKKQGKEYIKFEPATMKEDAAITTTSANVGAGMSGSYAPQVMPLAVRTSAQGVSPDEVFMSIMKKKLN